MKLWLLIPCAMLCFLGGCTLSIPVVWRCLEITAVKDISKLPPDYFPVLAQEKVGDQKFFVARWGNAGDKSQFVTQVAETGMTLINEQLRNSISNTGSHQYFSILNRDGKESLHVSMEVPTTHDSKLKGWYRIENGQVVPQRILFYGPGFAFMGMPWNLGAGLVTSSLFILIARKLRPFSLKK